MVIVGARHVWSIWFWEFSDFAISFSDVGVIFPAIVAVLLLHYSPKTQQLLKRAFERSKFLVYSIGALWLWIVFRGITSGDASVLLSVGSQATKSVIVLVLLIALIGNVGTRRSLNSFLIIGVVTVFISMIWYVTGVIALFPTWQTGGLFSDPELLRPRFGYEASYGKVLQYEGLAQDPIAIAIVYAGSLFGGLAAAANRRFAGPAIIVGIAVIQMAMILTLARSAVLTATAVLIFLMVSFAWNRDRVSGKLLGRFMAGGLICIGLLSMFLAVSQFAPAGKGVSFTFDDAYTMIKFKTTGNLDLRVSYQTAALSDTFSNVPTALFGHGAKTSPEGVRLIENLYLWVLYQYGLIGLGILSAIGIALLLKIRKLDKSRIQVKILMPFALWLAVVSVVAVSLYGISLWVLVALVLVEGASRKSANVIQATKSQPA